VGCNHRSTTCPLLCHRGNLFELGSSARLLAASDLAVVFGTSIYIAWSILRDTCCLEVRRDLRSSTCSKHNPSHNNPQAANAYHPIRLRALRHNFVDRINIGFAALTMKKELAITSSSSGYCQAYSSGAISYLRCLAISCCTSSVLVSGLRGYWSVRGIVAMLTGFARTATHLYVLRFLLGVAEAGFVPGIYLYLTYWFPQRQLAHAIALFNSAPQEAA